MENEMAVVRPRFVWGRRPRPNGGRRRPRGRIGFEKYPPVVSRGSYPVSSKPPLPPAPRIDQVPLHPFGLPPPSGDTLLDRELVHLSLVYGMIVRIRLLILARADFWTSSSSYRAVTAGYWMNHDRLLRISEGLRECGEHVRRRARSCPSYLLWQVLRGSASFHKCEICPVTPSFHKCVICPVSIKL